MLGIFVRSLVLLTKTQMTVKLATTPTEAITLDNTFITFTVLLSSNIEDVEVFGNNTFGKVMMFR